MSEVTRVTPLFEVSRELPSGEKLCLQQAVYIYPDKTQDLAFRVIRRDAKGNLKAQRGQAGIPELEMLEDMIKEMKSKCYNLMK